MNNSVARLLFRGNTISQDLLHQFPVNSTHNTYWYFFVAVGKMEKQHKYKFDLKKNCLFVAYIYEIGWILFLAA